MLDLQRLHVFLEVVRAGSFAGAAQALSYSPSAISQSIATLERELGQAIFERTGRGARLTEAGDVLVRHAELLVSHALEAEAQLAELRRSRHGALRVGSFPSATSAFAARAVDTLRAQHPDVEVSLVDGEPYESIGRLARRELDLALVFDLDHWPAGRSYDGAFSQLEGDVGYEQLFDDPFELVLPRTHALASHDVVALELLAGEVVAARAPWATDLEQLCRAAGFEPRLDASHQTADFHAYQAAVTVGDVLTLMPAMARGALRDDLTMRPLQPAPVRHIKLALPRDSDLPAAGRALVNILRDFPRAEGRVSGSVGA